jgi:CPA1 family monovalent cation:H+ antiporter
MHWNVLDAMALVLFVTAALAYLNHFVLRLPRNLGLLALALAISVGGRVSDLLAPGLHLDQELAGILQRIDFPALLLNGALPFLLFAGALEVDLRSLLESKWTILLLATIGVLLSTVMVGAAAWVLFSAFGIPVGFFYCLAFGALISPTDPVTVLSMLRRTSLPKRLNAIIAGESMFNDAIGIVLFTIFLSLAEGNQRGHGSTIVWALEKFVREAAGGAFLGCATGALAFLAMRGIDEYGIELMISLTLVAGTYGLAETVDVSGPVAVVIAGLIMGSVGVQYAVSGTTHEYLKRFWHLIDQLLNALLYLLMGLAFTAVALYRSEVAAALAMTVIAVVSRAVSIALPGIPLHIRAPHKLRSITVITWSGLRGGISLALALSLPDGPIRGPVITATYAVVVFTMLVQGLTLKPLVNRLFPPAEEQS